MPTLILANTILLNQGSPSATVTLPTIPAGANRCVAVRIHMYTGITDTASPTSVTSNGRTAVFAAGDAVGAINNRVSSATYMFFEADIAAISGQTLVSTGDTGTVKSVDCYAWSDASQSAPVNKGNGRAASGTITIPLTRTASSVTVGSSFSRVTDVILTLAEPTSTGYTAYTSRRAYYGIAADTSRTANFTSSTNQDTTAHVFNIEPPVAAKSINSTNSGANDLNAGAVNTASVTGYAVGVNPVVSGTVGSLALTSVSQATTIATFTIPAPVNAAYYPQPDTSHTLTLTDGSNPATFNAVMNSLAGYTSIVLASPDLVDPHKIPYWLTSTAVDGDRIMYKTADMTVAADGGISGATLGATTIYYHWRVADSKIYAYEALLSEDGIVTSTGLTVRGLTVSGPSVRGLTVRGLGGAAAMVGGFPYLLPFLLS